MFGSLLTRATQCYVVAPTREETRTTEAVVRATCFSPATEVPDDLFVQNLGQIDAVITTSMQGFTFAAHQAGASELVIGALKVIDLSRTEDRSIYKCYASYHWGAVNLTIGAVLTLAWGRGSRILP